MKRIILLALWIALWTGLEAQTVDNPFELQFRVESDRLNSTDFSVADPGNPFELRARPIPGAPAPGMPSAVSKPLKPRVVVDPAAQFGWIKMILTISMLLLLTFFVTLFRSLFYKAFYGFFNDNLMFQFYREQEGRRPSSSWLLYLLYPFNAGIFVFYVLHFFSLAQLPNPWLLLGLCLGIAFFALFLKHLVLEMIATVFPVEKEMSRYHFLMVVFGMVLGGGLVPVNILLAYGPESIHKGLIYAAFAVFILVYAFRGLRGLLIANKFLLFHKFHFLLYICTVEIAPVLIIIKLILDRNQI